MGTAPRPRECCPQSAVPPAVPSGKLGPGSPTQLVCNQQGELLEVFLQVSSSGITRGKALPVFDVSLLKSMVICFLYAQTQKNNRQTKAHSLHRSGSDAQSPSLPALSLQGVKSLRPTRSIVGAWLELSHFC